MLSCPLQLNIHNAIFYYVFRACFIMSPPHVQSFATRSYNNAQSSQDLDRTHRDAMFHGLSLDISIN